MGLFDKLFGKVKVRYIYGAEQLGLHRLTVRLTNTKPSGR